MTSTTERRFAVSLRKALITLTLLGLVIAAVASMVAQQTRTVVAEFDRTTGLYTGSHVKILGVKVGRVAEIEQRGDRVLVLMEVDSGYDLPADVSAAIVAPSLVSGRYVQLSPVHTGGDTLADGAVIPLERTAVPVEWDDIKGQLSRLTAALGPTEDGNAESGPLANYLDAASSALAGNGVTVRETLASMSAAANSLSANQDNLFLTIRSLADFTEAMNASSRQIDQISTSISSIASVLADNENELGHMLRAVDRTMASVTSFVDDNREALDTSVEGLRSVSSQLADNQTELANILHLTPTALANMYNIYDPTAGTLTGRAALGQTNGFANFVCQTVFSLGGTLEDCKTAISPLADLFNMDPLPISTNPLLQSGTDNHRDPGDLPEPGPGPEAAGDLIDGISRLLLGANR